MTKLMTPRGALSARACLAVVLFTLAGCLPGNSNFDLPSPTAARVTVVAPSALAYATNPAVYTKGLAVEPNTPAAVGDPVTSWAITPRLPAGLVFDAANGVISGVPAALSPSSPYTVTATNAGGSTTVVLTLGVQDVPPTALAYPQNPASYVRGEPIVPNTPSSSGGAITSFSVSPQLPSGLSLDGSTGVVSGTPAVLAPLATYTVTGTNSGGATSVGLRLAVRDLPPSGLAYTTNPVVYTRGVGATPNLPSVTGSVDAYSVSPPLPAGLTLNAKTGVVSGTPTALSSGASYTVTASNTGGSTTAVLNVTVNDAAPTGLAYAPNPAVYVKGTAVAANVPTAAGGVPVAWAVTPALPAGLSLDTTTGAVTGTPTLVSATATYTVTASNTGGKDSVALVLTVKDVAPSGLNYSSNPALYTKGQAIPGNFPTVGGGAVVSYSGALPPGLALNPSTGVITGTPSVVAASTLYTVTATNSGGSTTVDLDVTVRDGPPAGLAYSTPTAVYTRGTAIAANTPSSTGGTIVAYAVAPALPAGLALNSATGFITGTPSAVTATATYTVTATNSGGSTTATVTITVNDQPPANLTYSTSPASYTKGVAIAPNRPSSSGSAVVTYSVSPALPAGLSLDGATGVITGTPTAVTPSAAYTITASNSGGSTTATLTITVNDGPPVLSYATNPAVYTRSTAVSNALTNSGGAVSGVYAVTPNLPAGLTLNTTTGLISGTPTAVSPLATYRVSASNSGGSGFVDLSLAVNDLPPANLGYRAPGPFVRGQAIDPMGPTSTGGAIVSYAIAPALPSGLSLNPSTGVISGTPTAVTPPTAYTVTGTNSGGSTTATVTLTVRPVGRFAYVAYLQDSIIGMFTVDLATGRLRQNGEIATGQFPNQIVVDPLGRFAYTPNRGTNDISQFAIDATTGRLTAAGSVAAGTGTWAMAIDPAGKFAYAVNLNSDNVSAYSINASTGALTSLGAPFSTGAGTGPRAVTVDPTGRFVYVAATTSHTVVAFALNATTGALTNVGSVSAGSNPQDLVVEPTGKFLYVAADALHAFSINQTTGALTPVNNTASLTLSGVCLDPSGLAAYGSKNSNNGTAGVSTFAINPTTGAVTATGTVTSGLGPAGISVDPTGSYVYAANGGTSDISVYSVSSGALVRLGNLATRSGPNNVAFVRGAAPVRYVAKTAYVVNQGGDSVSAYAVNATTGALTSLGSPVATGVGPAGIAIDAQGRFAWVTNRNAGSVSAFSIDATTGALSPLGTPLSANSLPQGIALDAANKYVFVASSGSNAVTTFSLDATTGALAPATTVTVGSTPVGIAVDPWVPVVFTANSGSNNVSAYAFNPANGMMAGTGASSTSVGTQPVAVTLEGRGRFLYVTNQGSNNVTQLSVDLTGALSTPVFASTGATPLRFALDPFAKYAWVANQASNNVWGYAVDPTVGTLSPLAASPFTAGLSPSAVVVDPTGSFVYVLNGGANTVSVYTVDRASGSLTPVGAAVATGTNPVAMALRFVAQ